MDIKARHNFTQTLKDYGCPPLRRAKLTELQINLGYLCNQACEHCHVEAGPKRTELMTWETMRSILEWIDANEIRSVDLTGGAPEMNPHFRKFCDGLGSRGISITSRCNITVQFEPGQEDLAAWYAERKIRLVCSLPCYSRENVEKQRGKGVFGKSIQGLRNFNRQGYGTDPDLAMDLVYNPIGPHLPPDQASLEADYKNALSEDFDIVFNRLLTITNLPVKRFRHFLERTNQLQDYRQLLLENFNPSTIEHLMCRHLLSVDWQGNVYDCDFNQMLEMHLGTGRPTKLWEINASELLDNPVRVASHCYGCTAGSGSSCGGALG
ncbi:MAG: radical SAM/Cys-rich domain protein [Gammaproteobacteria bacterium]|nr:radical SAM/Cys-rich domain protein [Gammaproteobacteria bacterium]MYD76542.1 radical SAM/Cys-rich domain protein [Gammaproteobacteria bacterium]MYJ52016.1 radical SAM/Cys-rich domain protein [Gammaproteobacteria bacterium]